MKSTYPQYPQPSSCKSGYLYIKIRHLCTAPLSGAGGGDGMLLIYQLITFPMAVEDEQKDESKDEESEEETEE